MLHKLEVVRLPVPYGVALFVGQTLGAFAPLFSLLAIQRLARDRGLVREVFRQLRLRGTPCRWVLLSAALPIVIALTTSMVHTIVSPTAGLVLLRPEPAQQLGWGLVLVVPLYFAVSMFGSPLGEEPGWRGYVLSRFSRQGRGLPASVLIAVLWAVWHLPLLVSLGVPTSLLSLGEMAAYSFMIDALFLLSRGNLFVAMLCHQGVSTQFMFLAGKTRTVLGLAILFAVAVCLRLLAEKRLRSMPLA